MQLKNYILPLMFSGMLLAGCSNDNLGEPEELQKPDSVYINLNVAMAANTRSNTDNDRPGDSSDGQQAGQENENAVTSAVMYFYNADADDAYLTQFTARQFTASGSSYSVRTEVKPEELKVLAGKNIKLYVVANCTSYDFTGASYQPETGILKAGNSVNEAPLGAYGTDGKGLSVPMANYEDFTVDLTGLEYNADTDEFIKNLISYLNGSNTLDLSDVRNDRGTVTERKNLLLERCVARVDYKPGTDKTSGKTNIYAFGDVEGIYGTITSMQVFNVNKTTYLYRHTTDGDAEGAKYTDGFNDVVIFGKEKLNANFGGTPTDDEDETDYTSYRWVADYDWNNKRAWSLESYSGSVPGSLNYFLNQPALATKSTSSGSEAIESEIPIYVIPQTNGVDCGYIDYADLTGKVSPIGGYYPWLYITENTLPSTESMIRGLSSGIAFNMTVCDANGAAIKDFSGMDGITLAQIDDSDYYTLSVGRKSTVVKAVYSETVEGLPELQGYLMTYWYFFRHNIEPTYEQGYTGPMQFGVVRNNIYRISVTALNDFPVPFDPHDPDEPDPQNPAIAVELDILPWVKRDITVSW